MRSVKMSHFIEMMAPKHVWGGGPTGSCYCHSPLLEVFPTLSRKFPIQSVQMFLEVIQSYECHRQTGFSVLPGRQGTHFYLVGHRTGETVALVELGCWQLLSLCQLPGYNVPVPPPAPWILSCVVDPVLYRSCSHRHLYRLSSLVGLPDISHFLAGLCSSFQLH